MEERKKRGPHYKNGMPKEKRFTIRLDEKEHQEFIEKAKKKNMTIAEYLRYLVKKDK